MWLTHATPEIAMHWLHMLLIYWKRWNEVV
jgi:hypothetical protein